MSTREASGAPTDEFADYDGPYPLHVPRLDLSALLDAATLRALFVIIGSAVLILAQRSPTLYAIVIGVVLVVSGLAGLSHAWRMVHRPPGQLVGSVLLVVAGAVLLAWPGHTTTTVARIVGAALVVAGIFRLLGPKLGLRTVGDDQLVDAVTGFFLVASGLAVLAVPIVLGRIAVVVVAAAWFVAGLATILSNLRASSETSTVADTWQRLFDWIEGRPETASDRRQLYDKLFFEGPEADRRLSRFFILMALATAIASYGIVSDSTATVIGAMLVAPLMTPLMAATVSLVMGWPRRASMSIIVAVAGIGLAIGLGFVVGATLPFELSPSMNAQISSRISPTLADLAVAIAAGSAGAFGLSRPDVSDALPGVAVAIALVPPLAVSGLLLNEGQYDDAWGSFLLFSTNMVAILLAGALTFVLTGVTPIGQMLQNRRRVQSSLTLVGALGVLILAVLTLSSEHVSAEAFDRTEVTAAVEVWIEGTDLAIVETTVTQSSVAIVVAGSERPPSVDSLGLQLEQSLDRAVDLTVTWVPSQEFTYDSN